MEIEDLLKEAAEWRPHTEMPEGLERRALKATRRPPLRPMGIMRPRSAFFATALAGVACFFLTNSTPIPMPERIKQLPQQNKELPRQSKDLPKHFEQSSKHFEQSSKRLEKLPRQLQQLPKRKQVSEKRLQKILRRQSPLMQRFPVALDTVSDSVIVGSRVAVEATVYTPAYYAEPSSDGESTKYTPVKVALDDPDVIYSESQSESLKEN